MTPITIKQVLAEDNLHNAWLKVASNQGVAGSDGVTIEQFGQDLADKLRTLAGEVRHDRYHPRPLLRVEIPKKGGGSRPLSIPSVRDRVLQTAVTRVLTPVFELQFEEVSFAYRSGRSVDQAVGLIERLRDKGYRWVVDADIRRFFDEVDHKRLLAQVGKWVMDETILHLIEQWLKAEIVGRRGVRRLRKGIPQGSPLSPLLANLYLDQLDDELLSQGRRLVRYADDFVVLCKSREGAEKALKITEDILKSIKLAFNREKTRITHFDQGFRYLGVDFIKSFTLKAPKQEKEKALQSPGPKEIELPQGDQSSESTIMQQAFADATVEADSVPHKLSEQEEGALPAGSNDEQAAYSHDPALQTLFLTRHGSVLGKQQERFSIQIGDDDPVIIPALHVDQIMVFGNVQITTQAMRFCLERRVPIYLLNGNGRYYGSIDSFQTEPVKLHKQQFLLSDDEDFCLATAKEMIRCKISNSLLILRRHARHRELPVFEQAVSKLRGILSTMAAAPTLDQVRGYEGHAANVYFQAMASAIDPEWQFTKRVKRPPADPVNAMLSFGYTLLFYNVFSLLRLHGLNPHVGFLHPIRMGHPALVSDMVEEFRSIIVDSVVLNLVLNRRISPTDFTTKSDSRACLLKDSARRQFIHALEKKMNARVTHPNSGLKLDYRRCIAHQTRHLAAVIRGVEPSYRGIVLK